MTAKTLSTLTSLRILMPLILLLAVTAVFIRRRQMKTPEAKTAVAGIPTGTVTAILLGVYLLVYLYLTFGFRRPAQAAQISLRPLWSYRAAFQLSPLKIRRLGLARQILLNILLTVPAGLLLPMLYHRTRHPWILTACTVLAVSILTETFQYVTRLGMCETDDVINNFLGGLAGMSVLRLGSISRH